MSNLDVMKILTDKSTCQKLSIISEIFPAPPFQPFIATTFVPLACRFVVSKLAVWLILCT
jgi:hypothetical protein